MINRMKPGHRWWGWCAKSMSNQCCHFLHVQGLKSRISASCNHRGTTHWEHLKCFSGNTLCHSKPPSNPTGRGTFMGSFGSSIGEMPFPQGWAHSSSRRFHMHQEGAIQSTPFGWDNNFIIISLWCSGVLNCRLHWDLGWFIAWFNYVSKFN